MGVNGDLASEAYVDGMIDEVFLYNRPMLADEIQDLMNIGPGFAVETTGKLTTTWAQIKSD